MHKQLWIGLLLGVIAHAASGASVQSQPSPGSVQGDATDNIVFAGKTFVDLPDYGSITVSGTLTGDGIAYKNNTISIACYKDRRERFPDPKVYKWTIEDSPGWKEIFGKK